MQQGFFRASGMAELSSPRHEGRGKVSAQFPRGWVSSSGQGWVTSKKRRSKLESWEPTDSEETEDFFHEKCVLYVGLVDLIPPGTEQSKVIRSYVTFLELNSFEGTNRIEWFWHVGDLLERLSAERENKGRTQVLEAFRNSRDPTLNLYARVETWLSQAAAPPAP